MVVPRLTELRISGLRSLGDVSLKLRGLTVLIGDNGSGKSSILEALELLRCTAHESYANRFASAHGGLPRLLEHGAEHLWMLATIDDGKREPLVYGQLWAAASPTPSEYISRGLDNSTIVAKKFANEPLIINNQPFTHDLWGSLVQQGAQLDPNIATVAQIFRNIDVHLPFDVGASWASTPQSKNTVRGIGLLEPTSRLNRFGTNLANAYHALKNSFDSDHWSETLEYLQLGLGSDVRNVKIEAIPGGGHISLALETRHQGQVSASSLADGVLSYLAFVAMFRLDQGRSLLSFDEPELHLHPGLVPRVIGMFETMADRYPVVVATHSDRLLDALTNPAQSVVVTELDDRSRTQLRHLDGHQLTQWIEDYRGIGELRADGELPSVLEEPAGTEQDPEPRILHEGAPQ